MVIIGNNVWKDVGHILVSLHLQLFFQKAFWYSIVVEFYVLVMTPDSGHA